jgi:hypothetical protein
MTMQATILKFDIFITPYTVRSMSELDLSKGNYVYYHRDGIRIGQGHNPRDAINDAMKEDAPKLPEYKFTEWAPGNGKEVQKTCKVYHTLQVSERDEDLGSIYLIREVVNVGS